MNAGTAGDYVNPLVGVTVLLVRTYGTFTSTEAQSYLIISVVSMVMIEWLRPRSKGGVPVAGLLVATAAVATCVALSGSRRAVIWSALVISFSVLATVLTGRIKTVIRAIVLSAVLLPVGFVTVVSLFPLAVDAFAERWVGADRDESYVYENGVYGRAVFETLFVRFLLTRVPILGYGFGTGGNAASVIVDNGQFERIKASIRLSTREELGGAEQDWGRHILDFGPLIGIGFIIFRVVFAAWLFREAVKATRRSGDPGPLILSAFSGVLLYQGYIVALGAGQSYGWLFAGFTIAMCKASKSRPLHGASTRTSARPPARYRPGFLVKCFPVTVA